MVEQMTQETTSKNLKKCIRLSQETAVGLTLFLLVIGFCLPIIYKDSVKDHDGKIRVISGSVMQLLMCSVL